MEVDGVASGHVQDGLDDDLVVADPVPDLGEGGGAELLDLPDRQRGAAVAVDLEVVGVDPHVRLDLRCAGAWGWPVRMPMALIFRTPSGSGSPSRKSWWATAQTWS